MSNLSDFFKVISEGKKIQEEEFNSFLGKDFFGENFIENIVEASGITPLKDSQKNNLEIIENSSILENYSLKSPSLVEKSLGLLAEPSDVKQQNDPLTPLNQKFATLDDLQNHYKLFLNRIQQQLSTLGGGGEVRLEFLDDVDKTSAKTDNYFLKYDATINKWVGDPAGGVGITSAISITGVTTYYAASTDVDYIGVSADVPVTIDLPSSPSTGKEIIIKDEGNKVSTYNITIRAGVGASVENDTSVVMKINHQAFTYFYNGNNWYII